MKKLPLSLIGLTLMVGLVFSACSDDDNILNLQDQYQFQVTNNPDDFQFVVTDLQNATVTVPYDWTNSGTRATIGHSSTVDSGTATIDVYDDLDSLVYSNDLLATSNGQSSVGVAGSWRIVVTLANFYGSLDFIVQMQ